MCCIRSYCLTNYWPVNAPTTCRVWPSAYTVPQHMPSYPTSSNPYQLHPYHQNAQYPAAPVHAHAHAHAHGMPPSPATYGGHLQFPQFPQMSPGPNAQYAGGTQPVPAQAIPASPPLASSHLPPFATANQPHPTAQNTASFAQTPSAVPDWLAAPPPPPPPAHTLDVRF